MAERQHVWTLSDVVKVTECGQTHIQQTHNITDATVYVTYASASAAVNNYLCKKVISFPILANERCAQS